MILLRLVVAFLASIGRSTLQLLAATGRLAISPSMRSPRSCGHRITRSELGRQLLSVGYFSLPVVGMTALFTGAALALQILAGGARFNAGTGALDRRDRHRPGARPGARRVDGRGPRLPVDRGGDRHHARDRADRRAHHALHRSDEVPGAAARPRRPHRGAGAGRGRRRDRHLRRLSDRHDPPRLQPGAYLRIPSTSWNRTDIVSASPRPAPSGSS